MHTLTRRALMAGSAATAALGADAFASKPELPAWQFGGFPKPADANASPSLADLNGLTIPELIHALRSVSGEMPYGEYQLCHALADVMATCLPSQKGGVS